MKKKKIIIFLILVFVFLVNINGCFSLGIEGETNILNRVEGYNQKLKRDREAIIHDVTNIMIEQNKEIFSNILENKSSAWLGIDRASWFSGIIGAVIVGLLTLPIYFLQVRKKNLKEKRVIISNFEMLKSLFLQNLLEYYSIKILLYYQSHKAEKLEYSKGVVGFHEKQILLNQERETILLDNIHTQQQEFLKTFADIRFNFKGERELDELIKKIDITYIAGKDIFDGTLEENWEKLIKEDKEKMVKLITEILEKPMDNLIDYLYIQYDILKKPMVLRPIYYFMSNYRLKRKRSKENYAEWQVDFGDVGE